MKTQLPAFLNNELLFDTDISLPVQDLTIFRGMGAFDYMRTYNRKPFLLNDHLTRFIHSCELLGITHSETMNSLTEKINILAEKSPLDESAFRLIMTAGIGGNSLEQGKGTLVILTEAVSPYPQTVYEHGIKAKLLDFNRYMPLAKSLTYTQAVIELAKAKKEGFNEVIYHSGDMLTEGTTCNLFIVNHGKLMTPGKNVLLGTRRKFILSWAHTILPVEPRHIHVYDLETADEAFVTSTTREILPVIQIGDQIIGDGRVGKFTKELHREYLRRIPKP